METLLLIVLVLLILGAVPARNRFGTYGGGLLGTLAVIIVIGFFLGWFAV